MPFFTLIAVVLDTDQTFVIQLDYYSMQNKQETLHN